MVLLFLARSLKTPTLILAQNHAPDNLAAHKVAGVRESIQAHGAERLYLPPYSPDFNPIEACWAQIKQQLRSAKARSLAALETCLADALAAVAPHHMQACFRHCGCEL